MGDAIVIRRGLLVKFISDSAIVEDLETRQRIRCFLRGRFRRTKTKPLVGDIVEYADVGNSAVIESILKRRNELTRPKVANVDQVLAVFTIVKPSIEVFTVDTMLALIEDAALSTVIVINKVDLIEAAQKSKFEQIVKTYERLYPVHCVSAKTGKGLAELRELFKGKISVLAGPSGVGKSTLLNSLSPSLHLKISEVSPKTGRGRHTTTSAELLELPTGGWVVDTPGFALLDLSHLNVERLKYLWPEFRQSGECLFSDCVHIDEPGCTIKKQVETGQISPSRYESYRKLYFSILERSEKQ